MSRLRLSSHYAKLAKFHASDGSAKLRLEVEDASACDEVVQICRHLDLEVEVQPSPGGATRYITVKHGSEDLPPEDDDDDAVPQAPAAAVPEPTHEAAAGEGKRVGGGASASAAPAAPPPRKRSRMAMEAEYMLNSAPESLGKLAKFYNALMDAFPGYQGKLAKLMVEQLRITGYTAPSSSDSSSSVSSLSSSASKKKKKHKKRKKKKEKVKKEKAKKNKAKDEDEGEVGAGEEGKAAAAVKEAPTLAELAAALPPMTKDELAAELDAELAAVGGPAAAFDELEAELAAGPSAG